MNILRRDFLKYCAGSAAALGLEFSSLGTLEKSACCRRNLSYPISKDVDTTLDRTVIALGSPPLEYPNCVDLSLSDLFIHAKRLR